MSRPWFPLYVADYLADTAHLRAAQSGAYLHLIMHYWQHGGLPDSDAQLAAIARMTTPEWRKAKPIIQPFFQPGWRHKRIEEEIEKSAQKYQARAEAGKKGGKAKASGRQKPSNATANDQARLYQPQPQPHSQAVVDKQQQQDAAAVANKSEWRQEDFDLCDRVMEAMGLDKHDPQCTGAAYFCRKWLDSGWQPDLIVDTVRRVMGRRDKAPGSVKYFEQAIADAHAEMARPLPAGTVRSTGPPRRETFADIALELEERIRSRECQQPDDDYDGQTIDGTVNR